VDCLAVFALTLGALGCWPGSASNDPARDPDNRLPFGRLDAPRPNETVGRVVDVAGWALDDSAVRFVHVYVDRETKRPVPVEPEMRSFLETLRSGG
jgi:hypothetical protein